MESPKQVNDDEFSVRPDNGCALVEVDENDTQPGPDESQKKDDSYLVDLTSSVFIMGLLHAVNNAAEGLSKCLLHFNEYYVFIFYEHISN